jgi:hypothetical protein
MYHLLFFFVSVFHVNAGCDLQGYFFWSNPPFNANNTYQINYAGPIDGSHRIWLNIPQVPQDNYYITNVEYFFDVENDRCGDYIISTLPGWGFGGIKNGPYEGSFPIMPCTPYYGRYICSVWCYMDITSLGKGNITYELTLSYQYNIPAPTPPPKKSDGFKNAISWLLIGFIGFLMLT